MAHKTLLLPLTLICLLPLLAADPGPPFSTTKCHRSDKKALLQVQAALKFPYVLIAWNTPVLKTCCNWAGVTCDDTTGRVTGLDIDQINTTAPIPAAVANLHYLQSLTFHKNPGLIGPIPPAIGTMTQLTFLRLDWNSLSGPIPAFLAHLTNLNYLNIAYNQFSGSIPAFLADLPLTYIQLSRNKFTGEIPPALAKSSSTYLILSHNNLTGSIPKSFGGPTVFETIDLSRNQLEGDASILFGKNKPLQTLDLSRNHLFEFDLTGVVFPENLTNLDLNHNKIYGKIPKMITTLELQFLNVSYNRLCGKIPTGGNLGRFTEYEFFHNKCLCGTPLPAC